MPKSKKLIITVRVNEYMSRAVNPNVPFTPDEIGRVPRCRGVHHSFSCAHAGRRQVPHPRGLR
jgi:uncharacterized protein (DUF849 family)